MTDIKQLSGLIKSIQLEDIKLLESSCRNFAKEPGEGAEINVALNYSAKAILRSAEAFSVLADIEVLLTPEGAEDADRARVWARFELGYSLHQQTELSEGLLEEFAKTNGVFNAWSYWREFVQSTLLRMELPPLTLPLYRLPTGTARPVPSKSKAR